MKSDELARRAEARADGWVPERARVGAPARQQKATNGREEPKLEQTDGFGALAISA
jgi:hypothetical protein